MTITPAKYDLTIYQGATFRQELTFLQYAEGPPVDLTGRSFNMQIRSSKISPTVLAELTSANGMILADVSTGTVTLLIPATITANIKHNGVYDLEAVSSVDDIERWMEGNIILNAEVTRVVNQNA